MPRLPMAPPARTCESTRTCAGHCCSAVHLPFNSKSELRRAAMAAREFKRLLEKHRDNLSAPAAVWGGWLRDDGVQDFRLLTDVERMAVLFYVLPVGTPFMDGWGARSTEVLPAWSCVAWDRQTGLCREYEKRPQVCRDYPYGNPCQADVGGGEGCNYINAK